MPEKVRTRKRRVKVDVLTEMQRTELEDNLTLYGDSLFDSPEAKKLAYVVHGEKILKQWISEHPGTRPWCWWEYSAPERRRLLSGDLQQAGTELHYGMPAQFYHVCDPIVYESQTAYLVRLDLLTKKERQVIDGEYEHTEKMLERGVGVDTSIDVSTTTLRKLTTSSPLAKQ